MFAEREINCKRSRRREMEEMKWKMSDCSSWILSNLHLQKKKIILFLKHRGEVCRRGTRGSGHWITRAENQLTSVRLFCHRWYWIAMKWSHDSTGEHTPGGMLQATKLHSRTRWEHLNWLSIERRNQPALLGWKIQLD